MNKSQVLKLGIPILSIFIAVQISFTVFPSLFGPWSSQVMDQLARLKYHIYGSDEVSPDIVHVDISDSSLQQMSPNMDTQVLLIQLLQKLQQLDVSAIAIDTVLPYCVQTTTCSALVKAVSEAGNVYLPVVLAPGLKPSGSVLPTTVSNSSWELSSKASIDDGAMRLAFHNFNSLSEASAGLGHITGSPDSDGVFRRFTLLHQLEGRYMPSLTTGMLADTLSVDKSRIRWLDNHVLRLPRAQLPDGRVLDIDIPLDTQGRLLLNFPGPWEDSFFHYSAAQILKVKAGSMAFDDLLDELEGGLVIISDVTTASRDFGPIALQNTYPLSGIHATIANAILLQHFQQAASPVQEFLLSLVLALALILTAWRLQSTGFTVLALALLLFLLLMVFYAYVHWRIEFSLLRNGLSVSAVLAWVNWRKYFLLEKEKARIRARFEQYLAPEVLKKILRNPHELDCRERKVLTILFSDIVDFTAWSSDKSPEVVHRTLNQYFKAMADIVFRYDGTVDKYMGDGLLVFFGDPVDTPQHPLKAVQAAQEMQHTARILRKQWQVNHGLPLKIRIGINSGEVIVGNLGSQKRLDYTVIGANVNLAQRLEKHAPPGGILISSAVAAELPPDISLRPPRKILLEGFEDKVEVLEIAPKTDI